VPADLDEINDHQMVAVEYGACVPVDLVIISLFMGSGNSGNEFEPSFLRVPLCAGGEQNPR